jgi:hypothetical protein
MSDARLRRLLRRAAADGAPDAFESVVTSRRTRWRVARIRVAAVGAGLAALLLAVVPHPPPQPAPRLAAATLPPTTDWLLETPRADWLTHSQRRPDKERPDGR